MLHSFVLRCIACGIIGLGSAGNLAAVEDLNAGGDDFLLLSDKDAQESFGPAAEPQKTKAGQQIDDRIYVLSELGFADGELQIHVPEASFIKVHFSQFNLPKGVVVEISSPDGSESYRYERLKMGRHTRNSRAGDDGKNRFSAMSITGDTAIVRVIGAKNLNRSLKHRLAIDYYIAGYPKGDVEQNSTLPISHTNSVGGKEKSKTKSLCGIYDRVDAVCYESLYPDHYDAAKAVARLLINGRSYCTAWRVGAGNHLFTNEHCISDQVDLEATEIWFDYEQESCGGETMRQQVKVTGAQLFDVDYSLDYALFSVNNFDAIADFGHFGLEVENALLGEHIYIPQHGGGQPKQIAIESDMNLSGLCEIDATELNGFAENADIGYFCDTSGGSSGSPVVLQDTNNVIALHHAGGCVNQGVKMSLIWPQVSQHFGGMVPVGSGDSSEPPQNIVPKASFASACTELSCDFDATASNDPDGQLVDYRWDFGDGSEGSGVQVSKTYSGAGNREVRLVVEDNSGDTHSVAQMVSVDEPNASPLAAYSVN